MSNFPAPSTFYISFIDRDAYLIREAPLLAVTAFEQVLVSESGAWGIMSSHETHMLLGANRAFFEEFRQNVPNIDEQVDEFLESWKEIKENGGSSASKWLPSLLKQIYGSSNSIELLEQYGLMP